MAPRWHRWLARWPRWPPDDADGHCWMIQMTHPWMTWMTLAGWPRWPQNTLNRSSVCHSTSWIYSEKTYSTLKKPEKKLVKKEPLERATSQADFSATDHLAATSVEWLASQWSIATSMIEVSRNCHCGATAGEAVAKEWSQSMLDRVATTSEGGNWYTFSENSLRVSQCRH